MKDLHSNIEVVSILSPIVVTGTATPANDIDLAGCNSAELVIDVGLGANLASGTSFAFTLQDSPDGTTYSDVETADMLGVTVTSATILTLDAATEDNTIYHFGYVGGQRYLQLTYTVTGSPSVLFGVSLIKGHLQDSPVIA